MYVGGEAAHKGTVALALLGTLGATASLALHTWKIPQQIGEMLKGLYQKLMKEKKPKDFDKVVDAIKGLSEEGKTCAGSCPKGVKTEKE